MSTGVVFILHVFGDLSFKECQWLMWPLALALTEMSMYRNIRIACTETYE